MKKLYLLLIMIVCSLSSYGQEDCANALPVSENTNYSLTLEPFVQQWFKFTMPQDGKLEIDWNSDQAQAQLFSGDCGELSYEAGGISFLSYLEGTEGQELVFSFSTNSFSEVNIDFSFEVKAFEIGDFCSDPITAVEGVDANTIPATLNQYIWYQFQMPPTPKKLIISDPLNARIEVKRENCTTFRAGNFLGGDVVITNGSANEIFNIQFTLDGTGDVDWSLTLEDFENSEACTTASIAVDGVNSIPSSDFNNYWFKYTMPPEGGRLNITSAVSNSVQIYTGACSDLTFEGSGQGNTYISSVEPGEEVLINWFLSNGSDFDFDISTEPFSTGDICNNAAAAMQGTNTLPEGDFADYWYSFTVPNNNVSIAVTPHDINSNYQIYKGNCDNLTLLVNGFGDQQVSGLSENEQIYIKWKLNETRSLSFDFDYSVVKQEQEITFESLESKTLIDADFDLAASASSGLAVSYTSSNTAVATISGSTVSIVGEGSTVITASQAGDEEFNPADPVEQTLTVTKADQNITFAPVSNRTFGDADFDLTATASSTLEVDYTSSNTAVATITGTTVSIIGAGTTTITASQAGNDDYIAADPVEQILIVEKADQTITFDAIEDKEVGDASFTIPASTTSGLTLSFNVEGPATVSGNTLNLNGETGTVTVTASQAGNDNYNAAESVTNEFLVTDPNKTDQTITFDALSAVTFGAANFDLAATASSTLALSYESSNESVATVSGSTVTIVGAGTTSITATQEGDATFNPAQAVSQELVVNKADQSITISEIADKEVTDEPFEVVASVSSGLDLSYAIEGPATISGTTITLDGTVGTVTVTISQSGNANYKAVTATESFAVTNPRSNQTISITAIEDKFTDAAAFDVEATTTSDLSLTYAVTGPATIEGKTITLEGTVGTVEVTVSQAGNDTFNPASASLSFEVLEAEVDPCLDFAATATAINLNCSGSADGSITVETTAGTAPFTYSLAGAEAVESNEFTALEAGEYSIEVTDANGCTATTSATITSPDALEITAQVENSNSINGNGSISLTVTGGTGEYTYSWSNDATTAAIAELEVGEYTVTVTDENGCSIEEAFTIGGVTANEEALSGKLLIFPNPAKDIVEVQHQENSGVLKLYDARGKLLKEIATDGERSELNVSQFPSGLYFIRTEDSTQLYRFVKE